MVANTLRAKTPVYRHARRRRMQGHASFELVVCLVAVGLAGLGAVGTLGNAFDESIAGEVAGGATASELEHGSGTGAGAPLEGSGPSRAGRTAMAGAASVLARAVDALHALEDASARAQRALRDAVRPADIDAELTGAVALHGKDPRTGLRVHLNLPNAEPPKGGFPTVLAMPGLGGYARYFTSVPQHVLDAGFAVAIVDIPNALNLSLRSRVNHGRRAIDLLEGMTPEVNMGRFGVFGHSFGGATTLVLDALDERSRGMVGLAPGHTPSPDVMLRALSRARLPRGHGLIREALEAEHGERLIVGAQHEHLVNPRHYAEPIVESCTAAGHCTYVELAHAGHANFADVPLPKIPFWSPTRENPFRVRAFDLTALSPRARTGDSQRRAAGELTAGHFQKILAEDP